MFSCHFLIIGQQWSIVGIVVQYHQTKQQYVVKGNMEGKLGTFS